MAIMKTSKEKQKSGKERAASEIKAAQHAIAGKPLQFPMKKQEEPAGKNGVLEKKSESTEKEQKSESEINERAEPERRSLEEELRGEREADEAFARRVRESPAVDYLHKQPVDELRQELEELHQAAEVRGYITREEERQVEYVLGALDQKQEDQDAGLYTFSEEAARTAGLAHQLGEHLRDMYREGKREKRPGDVYQG